MPKSAKPRTPDGDTHALTDGLAPPADDRFLAQLSHELRTPLNGVLGMAGLLSRTRLDPDQQTYVAAIRDCGEHLLGLVNDVLNLAKMEADRFELHPGPVDPERLLQTVCELLSPRARAAGVEIAWSAPAGLPRISADEGRLRQVLFNLAGNAVKFTDRGGVLLGVEPARAAAGQVRLRFTVADTGPGVPEAERARIFEPFAQASPSHGERADSTGLGLAIVRRLAEAMRGRVGLDCPPEGGSIFWIEADFPTLRTAPPETALDGQWVVVVSPNPVVRDAAERQIAACGGRAIPCASLDEAKAARPGAPVLIDYAMKRGRAAIKPLPGRKCLVLLAPEERGRIAACRRAGFDGYLIKPLRRASLATRVLAVSGHATVESTAPARDERASVSPGRGARVLLAEDNPINALLARALLEREGCSVDRVATGPEAVEAALAADYDLILMDLRMPGMDGLTAARTLRERGVACTIAALTANAFDEDRRACLAAGMDDFLTKPLEPVRLRALLAQPAKSRFTPAPRPAKLAS